VDAVAGRGPDVAPTSTRKPSERPVSMTEDPRPLELAPIDDVERGDMVDRPDPRSTYQTRTGSSRRARRRDRSGGRGRRS
jgi:hypothetical protein